MSIGMPVCPATSVWNFWVTRSWAWWWLTICIGNIRICLKAKEGVTLTNASSQTRVSNWIYNDAGMVYVYNSNGDRNVMLLGYNGHVSCVQVDQSSSRKVKKNIKPIEDAEKILLLDAVSFDYIDEERGTDQRGFIAEDVAEVLPNLVTPETEGTTASLNYIGMIPYLQDIIKKQEQRIQALEEKIEKLMEKEK